MKLINLTPHPINLYSDVRDNPVLLGTIPSTGEVRLSTGNKGMGKVNADVSGVVLQVPLFVTEYGQGVGLPDPVPNTLYIVSKLVKDAYPERVDLVSPAKLVRGESGVVSGCRGFEVHAKYADIAQFWTKGGA